MAFLAYLWIFLRALIGFEPLPNQATCRENLIQGNYTQLATIHVLSSFVDAGTLDPNKTVVSTQPGVDIQANDTIIGSYHLEEALGGVSDEVPVTANVSSASELYQMADANSPVDQTGAGAN